MELLFFLHGWTDTALLRMDKIERCIAVWTGVDLTCLVWNGAGLGILDELGLLNLRMGFADER